jgi:hypothetical protein
MFKSWSGDGLSLCSCSSTQFGGFKLCYGNFVSKFLFNLLFTDASFDDMYDLCKAPLNKP